MTEAEKITRASNSNLALAFAALPKERRRDMSTFYAFCRIVDDIVDEPAPRAEKEAALAKWRSAVRAETPGESALAAPVRSIVISTESISASGVPFAASLSRTTP